MKTNVFRFIAVLTLMLVTANHVAAAVESYAVFSGTTLTFYCDGNRNSRSGYAYGIEDYASNGIPQWGYNHAAGITKVVFDSSFATARPSSTKNWFAPLQLLQQIEGIENLNTSEVTDMSGMFNYCQCLTALDLSSWNTSKVTNMNSMFSNCLNLKTLDLSSWNTSKVTDMGSMFLACASLTTITCGNGWNTYKVTASTGMFAACTKLVGGQGTTYDAAHVDKAYAHADGGTSNPGYLTMTAKEAYAVYTASKLEFSGTLTFYYDNKKDSRPGDKYSLPDGSPQWYRDHGNYIGKVIFDPSFASARPTNTEFWFEGCVNLQQIDGLRNLNTSQVTSMRHMFYQCESLNALDLSNFDTYNVTDMSCMFDGCISLTELDLSSFNTVNVTDMEYMFYYCRSLTNLNVSSFDTPNVNVMQAMFAECHALTTLNVRSFDTRNVTNMYAMFYSCKNLTTLDLSSFFTYKTEYMTAMFAHNSNLKTIYVSDDWNTDKLIESDRMFQNCKSLVGGKGTRYDAKHTNKEYAHIDGGSSNPGYLTLRNKDAYAEYSNGRLTFYYDTKMDLRTGDCYYFNTSFDYPGWVIDHENDIKEVAFHDSFGKARPSSTKNWFSSLKRLERIDGMHYLNTSDVKNMSGMFASCTNLTTLDLSELDSHNVTNMLTMFYNCPNLKTIYCGSKWNTDKVTNSTNMFGGCTSLVGGRGTKFNAAHVDKEYAHLDGGTSNPGYFTQKGEGILGDVNGDGNVNSADVQKVYQLMAQGATGINHPEADVNKDGNVNSADIQKIYGIMASKKVKSEE